MPVVFVTYSLAYLGRSNFGFGAAAGLAQSLHITESRAAFLGSVFFLGYFLFQVPAATYAVRRSATRLVFFALISWGVFSGLTGIIRNYWLLVADRLLLGVAESLIFPSMLILLTHWFTRAERSRANAILILGNPVTVTWMAAVTGYLIHAVGLADDVCDRRHSLGAVGVALDSRGARPSPPGALAAGRKQQPTRRGAGPRAGFPCPLTPVCARHCACPACCFFAFNFSAGALASTAW